MKLKFARSLGLRFGIPVLVGCLFIAHVTVNFFFQCLGWVSDVIMYIGPFLSSHFLISWLELLSAILVFGKSFNIKRNIRHQY
jgi:hypothetical protein